MSGNLFWLPTRGSGSQIRTSSGPTPPMPPPWAGYTQWLRANDSPDGAIATLPDLSANHLDEIQATGANQPVNTANVLNGKKGLLFSGSQWLGCAAMSVAQPNTIFLVLQPTSTSGFNINMDGVTGRQQIYTDSGTLNIYAGSAVSLVALGTSPHIITFEFNGASSAVWVDGVKVSGSINPGALGLIGETMGRGLDGGGNPLNGYIFERITYQMIDGVGTNRKANQAALGSYYGITLGQPQITLADYNGLTGASLVSVGTGLFIEVYDHTAFVYRIWYKIATETAPSAPDLGTLVLVDLTALGALATAAQIAAATVLAMAPYNTVFTMTQVDGAGTNTAAKFVTVVNAPCLNSGDINTGASVTTPQAGVSNE